jgi:hypothetical protein
MPTIKINNETLEYNNIIYVDAVNGDDTNGDGSEGNPYASIPYVVDNTITNGDAIVLLSDILVEDYQTSKFFDIIGNQHELHLNYPTTGSIMLFTNNNTVSNFYNTKLKMTGAAWSYFGRETNVNMYFINCVLHIPNSSPEQPFAEYNSSCQYHFENCSFDFYDLYGSILVKASIKDFINSSSNLVSGETQLEGVTYDSDYNITSDGWENTGTGLNPDGTQAHIGVYGGPYGWGEWSNMRLVNLLFDPLYPFKNKDTNINLTGNIKEKDGLNESIRYRITLNGEQLYPESPYPYSISEPSTEDYMSTATGYETPEGTISASSEYSVDYTAWEAFNDTLIDGIDAWSSDGASGYLQVELNDPVVIKGYSVSARNYSDIIAAPTDWTFEGSVNGIDWVVLDTQYNINSWFPSEKKEFMISNNNLYYYYRIYVTANTDNTSWTSIGEMELFGPGEKKKGYTELKTTPFNIDLNLDTNKFNVGSNNLIIETLDENDNIFELLNTTITKEDRDTFTMNHNLNYDGSPILTGDTVIDNYKGLTLSNTGKGSAVIEIPTEGKARLQDVLGISDIVESESKTEVNDMVDQGSLDTGTVYEKEVNTDLDITDLNINVKST